MAERAIPAGLRGDVDVLWRYHDMGHELRPCDVGIGLGSHDPGVAVVATRLFHAGLFPRLIFTGANAPTTIQRYPRGEAVHYREYAIEHGVPERAVLVEPNATNTAQNLEFSQRLCAEHRIPVSSVLLMSRPYQQRRAYATCRRVWPEVDVVCASDRLTLDAYVETIGNARKVVDMLVGDTQRIEVYAERGFAVRQDLPDDVRAAFGRLVAAGFTSRLI